MNEKRSFPARNIAILDIGSNAVRLGICRIDEEKTETLSKQHEICQMGRRHEGPGLYPPGVERAIETLSRYCQTIRSPQYPGGVNGVVAVATDAIRRAQDGPDFIKRLHNDLDLTVRVIDEKTEGIYGAKGVLRGLPDFNGIVADLGGGSLQLTRVEKGEIGSTASLPLGTLRLAAIEGDLPGYVSGQLSRLPEDLLSTSDLCVIGGSWRTLGKLYLARAGDSKADLQGALMAPSKISSITDWLNGSDRTNALNDLSQVYHLEEKRIETLPLAAITLSTLIDKLGVECVTISSAGIRDGILQDVIDGRLIPDPIPKPLPHTPGNRTPTPCKPRP